jgi:ElaB/YqjD/DUF883 family membrane-anchored ribosome-binding protein
MIETATAINSLPSRARQADFETIELSVSEFQSLLKDCIEVYNQLAEMLNDCGILRGRELARLTGKAQDSLKVAQSPIEKLLVLNAYIKQLLTRVRDALKARPANGGKIVQVCSKIMARAVQIIDYLRCYGEDDPQGKRDVSLDSQGARLLFSGKTGEPVSRRDTIRAMQRAEALWPALRCGHRANDGRQTMRLTIDRKDLGIAPEFGYRDMWQRSRECVGLSL